MAIDIRATVTCSLGILISASVSDDYLQGTGLVKTRGSCEISGVITPAIGTVVTFSYTQNGVIRDVPRKLRVLSSFADPFRRTTKIELGCKLTYLQDLKEPVNWTAFDDPANGDYTSADAQVITVPINASSVMSKCLTELELTSSANPLTNKFSIAEFDFSSGYVQVLSDLLVSESYCGYLDSDEVLQLFSLNQEGGNSPVISSAEIIDLGPVGVGQLPGENVTVSYSSLRLKTDTTSSETADLFDGFTNSSSSTRSLVAIPYTTSDGVNTEAIFATFETSTTGTNFIVVNDEDGKPQSVVNSRSTVIERSGALTLGSFISAYLSNGLAYSDIIVSESSSEGFTYSNGKVSTRTMIKTESTAAGYASVGVPLVFSPSDYVSIPGGTYIKEYILEEYSHFDSATQVVTYKYGPWIKSLSGQQALAEGSKDFSSSSAVVNMLANALSGLVLLETNVSIESKGFVNQSLPSIASAANKNYAQDTGKASLQYRTESKAELELAVGSATAQRRIEFSLPYAPDDVFVKTSPTTYTAIKSDAAQKANLYGKTQNKLLLGNRSGMNLQLPAAKLPSAPFAPIVVQANGISALYRINGSSWTMDNNGIVASTDALFWGAVGGAGTLWFPVAPGITTLPIAPTVVNGQMTVGATVPVWNETLLATSRLRLGLQAQSLNYPLAVLTEPAAISVKTKLSAQRITSVNVPAAALGVTAAIPTIGTGVGLSPNTTAVQLSAATPVVSTGAAVGIPAAAVTLAGLPPEQAGALATVLNLPAADLEIAAGTPGVSTGSSINAPAINTTLASLSPSFAGATDPYFSSVGLLLHMDGANNSTTFTDSSANAHTVTVFADAKISTAQSKFGGASGVFDGTGDYLRPPATSTLAFGTGEFTVECWVYFTTLTGAQVMVSYGTTSVLLLKNASHKFVATANSSSITGTTTAVVNTWYHVAMCRTGTTVRMFVNGTEEGTALTGSTTNFTLNQPFIARRSDGTQSLFGYLDDVRITKASRYATNFTAPSSAFPDS
jgi:hypothetical protein